MTPHGKAATSVAIARLVLLTLLLELLFELLLELAASSAVSTSSTGTSALMATLVPTLVSTLVATLVSTLVSTLVTVPALMSVLVRCTASSRCRRGWAAEVWPSRIHTRSMAGRTATGAQDGARKLACSATTSTTVSSVDDVASMPIFGCSAASDCMGRRPAAWKAKALPATSSIAWCATVSCKPVAVGRATPVAGTAHALTCRFTASTPAILVLSRAPTIIGLVLRFAGIHCCGSLSIVSRWTFPCLPRQNIGVRVAAVVLIIDAVVRLWWLLMVLIEVLRKCGSLVALKPNVLSTAQTWVLPRCQAWVLTRCKARIFSRCQAWVLSATQQLPRIFAASSLPATATTARSGVCATMRFARVEAAWVLVLLHPGIFAAARRQPRVLAWRPSRVGYASASLVGMLLRLVPLSRGQGHLLLLTLNSLPWWSCRGAAADGGRRWRHRAAGVWPHA